MRCCKAKGIDPRSEKAPDSMSDAVDKFLGNVAEAFSDVDNETKAREARRAYAEDNLVLYATGTKERPSLSIYDNGEGQLAKDFPSTFCSLIFGSETGSYKGAINFVQGRFNMGSSGVLPFCSEKYKMQLIVSRVPKDVAGGDEHEWAFTLICFFASKQNPSWCYLVGTDGQVMTDKAREDAGVTELNAQALKFVVVVTFGEEFDSRLFVCRRHQHADPAAGRVDARHQPRRIPPANSCPGRRRN